MAAAWALLVLPLAHSSTTPKRFRRSLPFATFAILTVLLFGVSGIFTSYISKFASTSTLIIGSACGGYTVDGDVNVSQTMLLNSKNLLDSYDAATYVRQCYQGNPDGPNCRIYARPYLPFTANPNVSCPFGGDLCAFNNHSAFQMDTGQLDSHMDFGINAAPKNRIKFRRVCTCAPIHHQAGLTTAVNDSDVGEIVYVNAGPQPASGFNYTFRYSPIPNMAGVGYSLDTMFANADPTGNLHSQNVRSWEPDPRFNQTDSDITLMMLRQNDMAYLSPSDDPWITAQTENNFNVTFRGTNTTLTLWSKSYDINLLGCVDQYQVCNPNVAGMSGCTTLGGIMSAVNQATATEAKVIGFNALQITTAARFLAVLNDKSMRSNVDGRGGAALNASMMAFQNEQAYLPPNQWQIEISSWFAMSLAKEQASILEWATRPKNLPSAGWQVNKPTDSFSISLCNSQLIPKPADFVNFSIVGLVITLVLCGAIVVTGLTVDTVVGWLRKARSRYMRDQWEIEETLALHKAAYVSLDLWRDDGEGMLSSSVLLNTSPLSIPLRAGDDAESR